MRRLVPLLTLTALAVLFGCAPKQQFRPQRERIPVKVVSLSPGAAELVAGPGRRSGLAGRTQADNWPAEVVSAPIVAAIKPDYEQIAEIAPQVIVYDASLYSKEDIEKLKTVTDADLVAIQGNTLDEYIKDVHRVGSAVGSETQLNEYVTKVLAAKTAAEANPIEPKPKVAVLMPGTEGNDYIAGTGSFVADAVRAAGGEPVGPDGSIFVPLNVESFIAWNPDVVVLPGTKSDVQGATAVATNPRYQTVNAVKQKNIRVIDRDVLLRRGGRVDLLINALHSSLARGGSK